MRLLFILFACLIVTVAFGQKKQLDHDVYDFWKEISNEQISRDGQKVVYRLVPGLEDATLVIQDLKKDTEIQVPRGTSPRLSFDSKFVIFRIVPPRDTIQHYKRLKKKKDEMPNDSLGIYSFETGELNKIPNVKSFKVPEEWSDYLVMHMEPAKVEKDTSGEAKSVLKKESAKSGSKLIVHQLSSQENDTLWYITDYTLAKAAPGVLASSPGDDSLHLPGVHFFNPVSENLRTIFKGEAKFKQLTLDESATQAAFLADIDTTKALVRPYELFYWSTAQDSAEVLVTKNHETFPENWRLSENGNVFFSENGKRLMFGSAPQPILQDTSITEDEIIDVEIWNWQDTRLITQQNVQKENDKKASYLAMVLPETGRVLQLATEEIHFVDIPDEGNAPYGILASNKPYLKAVSWEGYPPRQDLFVLDMGTGERTEVVKGLRVNASISPAAKYVYWYNVVDSAWFSYSIAKKQQYRLTQNQPHPFYDEEDDHPDYPSPYGVAGWLENDEAVWIYDRYDIWQFDPMNATNPVNLTENGRVTRNVYRYQRLNPDKRYIDPKDPIYIRGFNEVTRGTGYFGFNIKKRDLKSLVWNDTQRFSGLRKAMDSKELIFSYENFQTFPDLQYTTNDFKSAKRISHANPQQSEYKWGTSELVSWNALDGQPLEGLLFKPEDFDPTKKYPMMVYFYEKNSQNLNNHYAPEPHRSIINFTFYTSRGYLVFVPDIPYQIGYPGPSAVNAVLSGVTSMIEKGFVDRDRIGVQGHSWGGYQSAFLVTRTDIFRCAEAGAPVSNMFSAYGGIRWGSGLSRMFQYEHTQSRIGGTIWEYPLRYMENSPIFFADKINTPLLIMHNDNDGAVPWYQGIELFVALRRLNKPSWMINYRGEPHWPTKYQNRKDWATRMQQFFDHYLKDGPAPRWMTEGVPAIETGINPGYERD